MGLVGNMSLMFTSDFIVSAVDSANDDTPPPPPPICDGDLRSHFSFECVLHVFYYSIFSPEQ
jgi:hypothetical protein